MEPKIKKIFLGVLLNNTTSTWNMQLKFHLLIKPLHNSTAMRFLILTKIFFEKKSKKNLQKYLKISKILLINFETQKIFLKLSLVD